MCFGTHSALNGSHQPSAPQPGRQQWSQVGKSVRCDSKFRKRVITFGLWKSAAAICGGGKGRRGVGWQNDELGSRWHNNCRHLGKETKETEWQGRKKKGVGSKVVERDSMGRESNKRSERLIISRRWTLSTERVVFLRFKHCTRWQSGHESRSARGGVCVRVCDASVPSQSISTLLKIIK